MRRDALNSIIVFNERHLRRVRRSYEDSYHEWRTYLSREMDAAESRAVPPPELGPVGQRPEVDSLHPHDERNAAGERFPDILYCKRLQVVGKE
jgi:hypothetical protein